MMKNVYLIRHAFQTSLRMIKFNLATSTLDKFRIPYSRINITFKYALKVPKISYFCLNEQTRSTKILLQEGKVTDLVIK